MSELEVIGKHNQATTFGVSPDLLEAIAGVAPDGTVILADSPPPPPAIIDRIRENPTGYLRGRRNIARARYAELRTQPDVEERVLGIHETVVIDMERPLASRIIDEGGLSINTLAFIRAGKTVFGVTGLYSDTEGPEGAVWVDDNTTYQYKGGVALVGFVHIEKGEGMRDFGLGHNEDGFVDMDMDPTLSNDHFAIGFDGAGKLLVRNHDPLHPTSVLYANPNLAPVMS
jgi:hypothetical protein